MAADTRQRMISAASLLLSERGYDGTGFRNIVTTAGAARGAIYHHFPGGKQQVGSEVAAFMGNVIGDQVERICAASPPREAVPAILNLAEAVLIRGASVPGCSIAAVALAADDPDGALRSAADRVFTGWQDALANCLERAGIPTATAATYSTLTMASIEGAVILCRAHGDSSPFARVRVSLIDHLEAISAQL
jgi:TetR/AcrR family transcriptional repressor of lmrAB and yxaGH operons